MAGSADAEQEYHYARPPRPDPNGPCDYAAAFDTYCTALLSKLTALPQWKLEIGIAEAKMNLLDRYCDFLTDTPAKHTNAAGKRQHRCIVEVLNDVARQIRQMQRMRLPPAIGVGRPVDQSDNLFPFGLPGDDDE